MAIGIARRARTCFEVKLVSRKLDKFLLRSEESLLAQDCLPAAAAVPTHLAVVLQAAAGHAE